MMLSDKSPLRRTAVRVLAAGLMAMSAACLFASPQRDAGRSATFGASFRARDSIGRPSDRATEAERCLGRLRWEPGEFIVRLERPRRDDAGDLWVTFASPGVDWSLRPADEEPLATVVLEWYTARDEQGRMANAPAVVVVHESGAAMTVGRMIARGFAQRRIHAFMVQLPGYGARRIPRDVSQVERFGRLLIQAVRDARRARDAVAVLPSVAARGIALQGTSLGGFVAATTAGIDDAFSQVFVLLAGGDLYTAVMTGKRDAEKVRRELLDAGLTERQIRDLAGLVEPLHLAHRIDRQRFWLFRGKFDTVVPPECSRKLARAIGLDPRHEVVLPVNHYSGIVLLPATLDFMAERIRNGGKSAGKGSGADAVKAD